MCFTNHKKVNYTNESIFIKKRLNKNHELIKHLDQLQKFLCSHSQNILKKYAKKHLKASDMLTQCILVYFIFYFNILINISVINQHIYIIFFRILIVMSIFMLLLSKSLFYSSIENSLYRNNLFDLSKNSWKQSFNFKKARRREPRIAT